MTGTQYKIKRDRKQQTGPEVQAAETFQHIIAGGKMLAGRAYIEHHN